jgi:hypothetical protein
MRKLLTDLQRRKDAKENPCDSCDGTGAYNAQVCMDCLGQGILLSNAEYTQLLKVCGFNLDDMVGDKGDWILDKQLF